MWQMEHVVFAYRTKLNPITILFLRFLRKANGPFAHFEQIIFHANGEYGGQCRSVYVCDCGELSALGDDFKFLFQTQHRIKMKKKKNPKLF